MANENLNSNSSTILFWWKGKQYPAKIEVVANQKSNMHFDEDQQCFYIHINDGDELPVVVKRFFSRETKDLVNDCIRRYQKDFPAVAAVRIKDSLKFWGLCNGKRELAFHWQLSMVSLDALEYVVIHELCHLHHLNHDRSFWRLVGKYCPDYEALQAVLAKYQFLIQQ